jgi:hypothetical protein
MTRHHALRLAATGALLATALVVAHAQRPGVFNGNRDHPAIRYSTAPATDPVARLNASLESGLVSLAFDAAKGGYLASVLDALQVPVSSQVLAFAETSLQASKIRMHNPRAIYFSDQVSVAWVRGGDVLELAAQDPTQGTIFYTAPMTATERPRFRRDNQCLACHLSWDTLAVPGLVLQTVFPRKSDRDYADGGFTDHRLPVAQRWGGWFVTGAQVPTRHMGNQPMLQPTPRMGPPKVLRAVTGEFDTTGYLAPTSDVAALLVLDHQVHATNLITRLNWEHRAGTPASQTDAADALAEYLLYADEAPLPRPVQGSSGYADAFAALGPRDRRGRSLRDLQLDGRTFRFPLSFMVYSPMYAALPIDARRAMAVRLTAALDGRQPGPAYAHLTVPVRQAIREILAETAPEILRPIP